MVEDNIDFLRKWEMMTSYTQLKGQTGGRRAKWKKYTWITGNYVIWYFSPKLNINKPLSTSSSSYQKVLWASCPGHVDGAQTRTAADYYCGSDTELALGKTHQTGCSMVKELCVQTPLEICLVKPKPSVFLKYPPLSISSEQIISLCLLQLNSIFLITEQIILFFPSNANSLGRCTWILFIYF